MTPGQWIVKVHDSLADVSGIADLKTAFLAYKRDQTLSGRFGRDVPYHFPASAALAQLRHLHLRPDGFPDWLASVAQHRRTSDYHLVYTEGIVNRRAFALIALLDDGDAHATAREQDTMARLVARADAFRSRH
jgi:hypothetical protein